VGQNGGGAGEDGGVLKLYLGADDDASIAYYGMQVVEDDLLIGPDTVTGNMKMYANYDISFFRVTGGSFNANILFKYNDVLPAIVWRMGVNEKAEIALASSDGDLSTTAPSISGPDPFTIGLASGDQHLKFWDDTGIKRADFV
jgi:hypothetical protein